VNFPVYAVFSSTHARLRARPPPPPPPHHLPIHNITKTERFSRSSLRVQLVSNLSNFMVKDFHDDVQKSAAGLHLDPTYSSPQPHTSLFSPQSVGQNCLCHLPPKFLTLHVFHMICVRVSFIFKTRNQNSKIYNGNNFCFLVYENHIFGHYADDCCL
jgi:hypothetical protein